jgi:hypothetical protein
MISFKIVTLIFILAIFSSSLNLATSSQLIKQANGTHTHNATAFKQGKDNGTSRPFNLTQLCDKWASKKNVNGSSRKKKGSFSRPTPLKSSRNNGTNRANGNFKARMGRNFAQLCGNMTSVKGKEE